MYVPIDDAVPNVYYLRMDDAKYENLAVFSACLGQNLYIEVT